MSVTDELYQQVILDYNREPRNFRVIENATHKAEGINPLCGDAYTIYMVVDDAGVIRDVAFEGQGCAISKASASLMTLALMNKPEAEAQRLFESFHGLLVGGGEGSDSCDLGKLSVFSGVWRYPSRVKCAALCWHAMKSALDGAATASTEDTM